MELTRTEIRGCYILKLKRFGDHRGWFMETFSETLYKEAGIPYKYIQDNMSMSIEAGTFRGMHCQLGDAIQGKLVSCVQGEVVDYIFDARIGSPTYGKSVTVNLNGDELNQIQVYVPEGCLHGFYVKRGPAYFMYKVTNNYSPDKERGILCTDPELGLDLPSEEYILSDKDKSAPLLKDSDIHFTYQSRCLVTGVKGQLGSDVVKELRKRGIRDIVAVDIDEMDITNYEQVEKIVTTYEPDVIFHCAAWTAVDKAEYMEENCRLVNVVGTKNLVEATKRVGAKFIYISTDYVFDGEKEGMYDISDEVNPKSIYGKTKYEGEVETRKYEKYFVVRTSWVFGENGNNFIKTMMSQYGKRDEVTVVDDQFGSPTFTKDLARLLVDMSETEKYGTYHANNEGFCSWYEFTKEIYRLAGYDIKVTPVSTEKYYEGKDMSKIAYRPKNSRLSKQCLIDQGFKPLPSWQDATEYYVHLLKNKERDGE